MQWIYISPHLDDVALSCGGRVWEQAQEGDHASIWTICAGDPPQGPLSPFAQSLHDRWETGREAIAQRREEDILSCRQLGASYRHFDVPDCIYRRSGAPFESSPGSSGFLYATEESIFGLLHPAEAALVEALWSVRGNPDLRRERIVEYISDRAGLLVPRGVGVYTFPHRSFQEYLAARYLTEEEWPDRMVGLLLADPERWREVALLAAAKAARGAPYAVWGLVEALLSELPAMGADSRAGWAAFIGAAALVDNHLHERVPDRHQPPLGAPVDRRRV